VSVQLVPDPNTKQIVLAQVLDPSRIRDAIDIPPGAEEILDVVMRPPDSDECVGWFNGGILVNQPPKYSLAKGRYLALIVVQVGGRQYRKLVRIVNDRDIDHFRLEDVGRETRPQLPPGHPLLLKA
jgi:hypothetical protein